MQCETAGVILLEKKKKKFDILQFDVKIVPPGFRSETLPTRIYSSLKNEDKEWLAGQGVSVTQSGHVMGAVFVATIIFTPLCGKFD